MKILKQLKTRFALNPDMPRFITQNRWYRAREIKPFLIDWLGYRDEIALFNRNLDSYMTAHDYKEVARKQRFVPKEIEINPKDLVVSNSYIRSYFLGDLPDIAHINQLITILNLPIPFFISYHIKGTKRSKIIARSNSKITALEAQLLSEQERGKHRNKEVEKHISELHEFADDILHGSEEAFYLSVYATIVADSAEQLMEYDKLFKEETQDIQFIFNNCFLNQKESLLDVLPLVHNQEDRIRHLVHTNGVCNLLPFLSKNTTDHEGIFLGSNIQNGSLVLVDLFKTDNANFNIFGKSGSGKSVTSKLIISRLVLRGVQNVIIDPEGEYTGLTDAYGGEVIEFSREKGINPFSIYTFDNQEPSDTDQQNNILKLKEFFRFFISPQLYESGLLGNLISAYFKNTKSELRNLPDFLVFLQNEHSKKSIPFMEDMMELSEGRSLGGYFSSKRSFDLSKEIISFNLKRLESEEVKIPAMYLLTSLVQKLADDTSKRTMIYVDEAHLLLKYNVTGKFLQTLSKTVRKRNTGLVCISQELEDFREENGGKSIIAQAESNFILKQSNISVNHIREKKLLPLTEDGLRNLTGMSKGTCIYIRQNEHLVMNIIPFETEKQFVFSTPAL